jgi:hypothetical protein
MADAVICELPAHKIPIGDGMHFDKCSWVTSTIFIRCIESNPVPNFSFPIIARLLVKGLWQFAISNLTTHLHGTLDIGLVIYDSVSKVKCSRC